MIGLVAIYGPGRPLADELQARWPESSHVYRASRGNCFQAPEAMQCALDRHRQVIAVGSLATVVGLLTGGLVARPRDTEVLCLDPGRRWIIPLAHTDSAEELAHEVAAALGVTPVLTGPLPAPEDPLAVLTPHAVRYQRGGAAAGQAAAEGRPVRLVAEVPYPLPALPPNVRPDAPEDAPVLRITDREDPDGSDLLVVPRTLVVGIGAGSAAEPADAMRLLTEVLKETGHLRPAIARVATVAGKGDHPAVRWAARCLNVPVDEHPAEELARLTVPNPSEAVGTAVGTASVAEAAALASAGGGELVVPKRKSATATVAIARAAVRGRLALVGLGPGDHDLLVPRALTELRRASVVVGRPAAVEAVAGLLRPGTRQVAVPEPGSIRNTRGEVLDRAGVTTDGAGEAVDHLGAAVTLAAHGHAVALVALGDGAGLTVPPGAYELHRVPGLPETPKPPRLPEPRSLPETPETPDLPTDGALA
ncbi:cobalamin biosynthesis protein [Kitasatospora sp. NPDC094011]|uniref:cobalamin biosynthesis protein n=1 Tax=Kitasatospora sp. NPDC094011 TaxID=3364090 RepID=UPI0037F44AFD